MPVLYFRCLVATTLAAALASCQNDQMRASGRAGSLVRPSPSLDANRVVGADPTGMAIGPDAGRILGEDSSGWSPQLERLGLGSKPQNGDAETLRGLQSSGRVQVAFQGLAPPPEAAGPLAADPLLSKTKPYSLAQTTRDIARVELRLSAAGGHSQAQTLSRAELLQPLVSCFFANVPVGSARLFVRVLDAAGAEIGAAEQGFQVAKATLTRVPLTVKLGRKDASPSPSGEGTGVMPVVTFEDAKVEPYNITGYWFVSPEGEPPLYPMQGCGQGQVWFVSQVGQQVMGRVSGYNDASAPYFPRTYWEEVVLGFVEGTRLQARGQRRHIDEAGRQTVFVEEVTYVLSYDAEKVRLTGTRNGLAGWGVPYRFLPTCSQTPPPILPAALLGPPVASPSPSPR
ncbi:MAG: hypothetical protein VKP62_14500 [Candidatus Sericytochromatia bacterium]|nr:hypothetical protein [Candidatus Sericytochromatia bacterium]